MNLKFTRYIRDAERVEADMDAAFQKAMAECSDPQRQFTEMEEEKLFEWQSGEEGITILPQKGSESMARMRAPLVWS